MKTVLILAMAAGSAAAQSLVEPPPLVHLIRRLGVDVAAARQYAEASAAVNVFGMTAVTGLPESWLLELHGSFASVEDLNRIMPGPMPTAAATQSPDELLTPPRSLLAMYRPGLSYRPDQAIRLFSKARYFQVSIYRVRPGAEPDFVEMVRSRRVSFDSMNVDRPNLAYQVFSGVASGTYLFLEPLPSLKVFDESLPRLMVAGDSFTPPKAAGEVTREHLLMRVDPGISYVADDVAAADPAFWRGKP